MAKKNKEKQDYTLAGVGIAVALTVVTVILGLQAVRIINPPLEGAEYRQSYGAEGWYLVYRSYRVLDRGESDGPEDDTVAYDFVRFPLDGSAAVGESLARVEVVGGNRAGAPWMSKVDDRTLLYARRADGSDDVSWIDVSGSPVREPFADPDVLWTGMPSLDGQRIAYFDGEPASTVVMTSDGNRLYEADGPSALMPYMWRGRNYLYLTGEPISVGMSRSLWLVDLGAGEVTEVPGVLGRGLVDYDLHLESNALVGNSFVCDSLERCGEPPSSLHLVDLETGDGVELARSDVSTFGDVRISPDGMRLAFTVSTDGLSDVWVSDIEVSGHERRVTSGKLLDWTPDGRTLIVDRDGEIQLVTVDSGVVRPVARRIGRYPDGDFAGLDYVGVFTKK